MATSTPVPRARPTTTGPTPPVSLISGYTRLMSARMPSGRSRAVSVNPAGLAAGLRLPTGAVRPEAINTGIA